MSKSAQVTADQVQHISNLAQIPISTEEKNNLVNDFNQTLEIINQLQTLDLTAVQPTHQVTGLENRWREDVIDKANMLTQTEALANAQQTYQGFFVVPQIIEQE